MPDVSTLRLLLWRAGAARCGAPIERLARVLPFQPATGIPGAPRTVRGLVNVRGELVTVVDCRTLLGEPDGEAGGVLVLVQFGARVIGLEVDEVEDIVTVPDGALRPAFRGVRGTEGGGAGRPPDAARFSGEWEAKVDAGPAARLLDLDALLGPLFPD